ncbi:hypothetical protein VPH35_034613 [Triticum aestivum]
MIKAKGKLHSFWIKMWGVPDTLRHYLGACEIGSALGPVVEVDVEHIYSKEEIRVKVGVRDLHKIPAGTEITTKDLLLYDIGFEFDSIAEQGWYKFDEGNKRKIFDYLDLENSETQRENDMQKKSKQSESGKLNVSLGSLGLKRYEQVVLKTGDMAQKSEIAKKKTEAVIGRDIQGEEGSLRVRLQKAEELAARQTAQLMLEEKKRKEMDIIRKTLEKEVQRHHELLQINLKVNEEVRGSQSGEKH